MHYMLKAANKSYLLLARKEKKSFAGEFKVLLAQAICKHARPSKINDI